MKKSVLAKKPYFLRGALSVLSCSDFSDEVSFGLSSVIVVMLYYISGLKKWKMSVCRTSAINAIIYFID
ncbi:MAG: hypothetical protein A3A81_03435 [Omnitrophica bacterium RIFCSPLOWO2_01_FULL_45_10b]|nr:MAG: hypothetical protein A3A81_03435 [Omnitrophica bacterium RIFCSPLOWO2_01_FULL_45_10b]